MSKPGALKEARPATEETQALADQFKAEIEAKEGTKFDTFKAEEHATQVVAGTNHFIRVNIGGGNHLHLRIFQSLQGQKSLHSYHKKAATEPLTYF